MAGRPPADLAGRTFGRLTALAPTARRVRSRVVWRCRCRCGRVCLVPAQQLQDGGTRSCGCLGRENSRRQGEQSAGGPPDARKRALARRLREQGMSYAEIGRHTGVSRQAARMLLIRAGKA